MPLPKAVSPIVSYEDPVFGSASSELEALGDRVACKFLKHLGEVHGGSIDHRTLLVFESYRGIPLYRAEFGGNVMIYAVEDDGAGDRKISVMYAGRSAPLLIGMERLIVIQRAQGWFR